jgi:hypothetical protein
MIDDIMVAMDKLHYTEQDKTRALRGLGVMDDSVITILNKGVDSWKKFRDAQIDIGVVTNDNIKAAESLTNAWYTMTQKIESLGRSLLGWIVDPLVQLFGAAGNVAQGKVEYPAKGTPNFFNDAGTIWNSLKKGANKALDAKTPTLNDRFGPLGDSGDIPKKATPNQFSVGAQAISGASQTANSLGITPAQYDAFRQGMANIESSGGNYGLMGGAGRKYAGAYQLSREEIDRAAKSFGEQSPTTAQFLGNKAMQERYFDAVTRMNHEQLMKTSAKYASMSPADQLKMLGYAHNQGAHGAAKFLETGRVGSDAFGTPGTRYISEIDRQLKGSRGDAFDGGGTPLPLLSNPRLLRAPRYNMGYGQGGNYSTSETVVHSMIVNGAKQPTDDAYGIAVDANQSLERGRMIQQFTTGPM